MPRPGQAKNRKRKRESEMTSKAVGGVARAAPAWSLQTSSISNGNGLLVGRSSTGDSADGIAENHHATMEEAVGAGELEEEYDDEEEVEESDFEVEDEEVVTGVGRKDKSKSKKGNGGAQVLPVADLPDDWEGDIEDGATYLALAMYVLFPYPLLNRGGG
jgi:hypothetical protein